ncbi:unnamed protein product [Urochloa decumbens]|uniref:Uncharacterized protein n=1 Tax=Urochloa decumbens TaxID=240449 RepID=A0ABC8YEX0_9POAL
MDMDRYLGGNNRAPFVVLTAVVLVIAASSTFSSAAAAAAVVAAAAPGCEASLGWDLDRSGAVSGALSSECCDVLLRVQRRRRAHLVLPGMRRHGRGPRLLHRGRRRCAPGPAAFFTEPLF